MKKIPSPGPLVRIKSIYAAIVLLAIPMLAGAGVFSVSPVRIYMGPRDRAVAVTIVNEGDTEIAMQADLNEWSQKPDGTDELRLTEDLILSPPIIKLPPNGRQVVRLALLKPADASRQLTYRLILREVPEAVPPKEGVIQIPIALALSLPVFITPPIAKREVACQVGREAAAFVASCKNTGTAYAQIREATLLRENQTLAKFEGGAYILPGAQKLLTLKSEQSTAAGKVDLRVTFDDGKTQDFPIALP